MSVNLPEVRYGCAFKETHCECSKANESVYFGIFTLIVSVSYWFGVIAKFRLFTTLKILFGIEPADELESAINWEFVPRILMAIVGGATLAMRISDGGGLGNPLVSPLTLGAASGAALGAALAIILDFSIVSYSNLAIVFNAFLFSLIVVAIIQLGNYRSVSADLTFSLVLQ